MRKLAAESLGTFILVFGGCGTAVLAAKVPIVGAGIVGIALAFGLTVLAGVYALGPISGAHFNPAVSVGLACAGRFSARDLPGYVGAQLVGGIAGAGLVFAIANGAPEGYDPGVAGLAANGFGAHSPGHYGLGSALLAEVASTFVFVTIIAGATARAASSAQSGIAIGLTLTLIHLIGIPVTNVSVNPARSTGPALFVGGWAISQLWLFWVAPLLGAALAGLLARLLHADVSEAIRLRRDEQPTPMPGPPYPTAEEWKPA